MYIFMNIKHTSICIYISTYIYIYENMYICMCIYFYVRVNTYEYIGYANEQQGAIGDRRNSSDF